MLIEPNLIIFYVDNLAISSQFYQDLLGISPEEASETFHAFRLSNTMSLALKAKHTAEPPTDRNGGGELAFILDSNKKVDALFESFQAKKIKTIFGPSLLSYGYNFVALDPDGNRLRMCCVTS